MALEVALAVVLLTGAGLFTRAMQRRMAIDLGFQPEHVLTLRVSVLGRLYPDGPAMLGFWAALEQRLRHLPGVTSVALTMYDLPFAGSSWITFFGVHGRPLPASRSDWRSARFSLVGGDLFTTLGVPVLRGRGLQAGDNRAGAERVVVMSEAAVRQFFPNQDPLGRRVWLFGPGDMDATVAGVVADVNFRDFAEGPEALVYVPTAATTHGFPATQWIYLRTDGPVGGLLPAVRAAVAAVDAKAAIDRVSPLSDVVSTALAPARFNTIMLGAFAGIALLLAGLGLYAVVAWIVNRQRHEIGIRMALGARRSHAVGLVARHVLLTVSAGLVGGICAAVALGHLLSSLLFGVPPSDPITLAIVIAVLSAAALLACFGPARRAASVPPTEAMRTS
jgi:putative ABC transport system permease protein